MISEDRIRIAFQAERARWGREEQTDYIRGIVRGLLIAQGMVVYCKVTDRYGTDVVMDCFECKKAKEFFQAIWAAYKHLIRGNRGVAMERLRGILVKHNVEC